MTCGRCGADVHGTAAMIRRGQPVELGIGCGCLARWQQFRELWEFEVTGVVPGVDPTRVSGLGGGPMTSRYPYPGPTSHRRHVAPSCWCGSGHEWTLAKHGFCSCNDSRCSEVHKAVGEGQ